MLKMKLDTFIVHLLHIYHIFKNVIDKVSVLHRFSL